MKSGESAWFRATAVPAGLVSLAAAAWLGYVGRGALLPGAPLLGLAILAAVLSWRLSLTTKGREKISLELAYFIAAGLLLPFPSAIIAGAATALAGSILMIGREGSAGRLLAVTGANVTVATAMTAAASAVHAALAPRLPEAEHAVLQPLLLACAMFAAMNAVNLAAMGAWVSLRGESPALWVRRFIGSILPFESVTIPFGCLLYFIQRSEAGHLGFVLLASIALFVTWLLKIRTEGGTRLRQANIELEERVAELATLNAIGREISSSLDSARVFEIIRRECRKVFRPDFFYLASVNHESREVRAQYVTAGESPVRALTFALGQGLTSWVVDTGRALLILDAARDPRLKTLHPVTIEPRIRSIVAVPLMAEGRTIGVLSVQSLRAAEYNERHVSLLTTIGQQAAVALENARHYRMATVDQMTGLFQRDHFLQRLGDEHRRSSRYGATFSILMLDLDSFKSINDRFGHFAGDRYLRAAGQAIRANMRAADIPCRYGGEEFAILLPSTDLAGARAIAERIRREIASLRSQEGAHTLGSTVSIGVASFPDHFEGSLSGLLQKADQALYLAKQQGRDRVVTAAT